jgi:5-epi-alpha-selinene synthase
MTRLMNGVTIPQIYCPFDFAISPFIEAMHEGSMKWACDMGLVIKGSEAYDRLASCRSETLAAYILPFAERGVLQLTGDFVFWLFFHDDYVDKARQGYDSNRLARLHAQLFAVLDGQPLESAEPVAVALQDICKRVAAQSNRGAWPKHFACAVKNYLQSNGWERRLHDADAIPDVSTYLKMRLHTSACWPTFIIIAISSGIAPDAAFLEHTYIKVLTDMANYQISYVNDGLFFERENKEQNPSNLVIILRDELGLSWQEAVNRVIDMANREAIGFARLRNMLPSFGSEDGQVRQYLTGLELFMRGHIEWGTQVGRYQDF